MHVNAPTAPPRARSEKMDLSRFDLSTLRPYLIDLQKAYPKPAFLLSHKGAGCFPKGDIQLITGAHKSGKSFAVLTLEVALLNGSFGNDWCANYQNIKVLHIDTEQHESNVADRAKKLHRLCEWETSQNNERFKVLTLRTCSPKERLDLVETAIVEFSPDFVVIDGIRDLCNDFNDIEESAELVNTAMRLSSQYAVAILCVLHRNKTDANARGHLGTELNNKCSDIYSVTLKDSVVTLVQNACRNAPIDDSHFYINEYGIPEPADAPTTKKETKQKERTERFLSIFGKQSGQTMRHTDLCNAYMAEASCQERTAMAHIKEAVDSGLLTKQSDRTYLFNDPLA